MVGQNCPTPGEIELRDLLTGKGVKAETPGREVIRPDEEMIRVG